MATRQFRNVALFIMTKLCKTLKHHLLRTDLHNHISTYHSGILTLSDLTMSNFTMLVKMYTLYTKLSYTKTGRLEVRDHKRRLKVLIYTMRPSLGGTWATYKWSYILLYLLR